MSRELLVDAVTRFAATYLADRREIVIGCSGGADSLALAHAAVRVLGVELLVGITVDHQLQPGSAEQSVRVRNQLRDMGYRRAEIRTVNVTGAGGPEAAARSARYAALDPGMDGASLLAHTLDDQAETVLLGLGRGSGPRSVAGMRAWRAPWGRPLLAVRRSDTENYCRAVGLDFWQDPHNLDPGYRRVRLRREVLPLLEDVLGGGVAPALARTAHLMADDLAALDEIAEEVLPQVVDRESLVLKDLRAHPAAVRTRVLRSWCAGRGVGGLTFEHLSRLDRLVCEPGADGAAVRLAGGVDAVRESGLLWLRPVG